MAWGGLGSTSCCVFTFLCIKIRNERTHGTAFFREWLTNTSNGKNTIAKCVQTTPLTYLHSSQIITTIMKILLGRCFRIPKIPTKSGFLSNYKFLFDFFFWGGGEFLDVRNNKHKKNTARSRSFLWFHATPPGCCGVVRGTVKRWRDKSWCVVYVVSVWRACREGPLPGAFLVFFVETATEILFGV